MSDALPLKSQPIPRRTSREGRTVETSNPLAELFGSRAKAEVIRILFGLSSNEVYISEIIRRSGLAGQGVDEQLRVLFALGLVTSRPDGNRRYFQANREHPFYPDLRALVLKSSGMADVISEALTNPGIELAFVFGSIARREERADSDVDLMVFGSVGFRDVASAMRPLSERLGREVNPHFFTRAEVGRRLKDEDHFLKSVLASPKLFVVGDEVRLDQILQEIRRTLPF